MPPVMLLVNFCCASFRLLMRIFGSSQYHHFQVGNILCTKSFGINLDGRDLKLAIHGKRNCTTTGSAGELAGLELFLHFSKPLLHLLDFTHVHSKISSLL